jgi:hypothetical protein
MTIVIIEDDSIQAEKFVEYARTLPFVKIEKRKANKFKEAVADCNGITVDSFFDELDSHIEKWTENA